MLASVTVWPGAAPNSPPAPGCPGRPDGAARIPVRCVRAPTAARRRAAPAGILRPADPEPRRAPWARRAAGARLPPRLPARSPRAAAAPVPPPCPRGARRTGPAPRRGMLPGSLSPCLCRRASSPGPRTCLSRSPLPSRCRSAPSRPNAELPAVRGPGCPSVRPGPGAVGLPQPCLSPSPAAPWAVLGRPAPPPPRRLPLPARCLH